jgi:hypothetical protein
LVILPTVELLAIINWEFFEIMSNHQIHKFSFSLSALKALHKDQLSAFLLLGLFLNEVNWLQKLLLVSMLDQSGSEAEHKGRLSLSLMLSKMLAAKIHEGCRRMQSNPMKRTLEIIPSTERARLLHQELAQMVAYGSLIYSVRNFHASHYPTKLSLDELPGIDQSELSIYFTKYNGDTISLVSELSAAAEMIKITGKETIDEAIGIILDEIIKAVVIYCEILHLQIEGFIDVLGIPYTEGSISNDDAPALDSIHLHFFASQPETH